MQHVPLLVGLRYLGFNLRMSFVFVAGVVMVMVVCKRFVCESGLLSESQWHTHHTFQECSTIWRSYWEAERRNFGLRGWWLERR